MRVHWAALRYRPSLLLERVLPLRLNEAETKWHNQRVDEPAVWLRGAGRAHRDLCVAPRPDGLTAPVLASGPNAHRATLSILHHLHASSFPLSACTPERRTTIICTHIFSHRI